MECHIESRHLQPNAHQSVHRCIHILRHLTYQPLGRNLGDLFATVWPRAKSQAGHEGRQPENGFAVGPRPLDPSMREKTMFQECTPPQEVPAWLFVILMRVKARGPPKHIAPEISVARQKTMHSAHKLSGNKHGHIPASFSMLEGPPASKKTSVKNTRRSHTNTTVL